MLSIEPLSVLTSDERNLLKRAIEQIPELARLDLVVYRCDDAIIVAPADSPVRVGMRVIGKGSVGAFTQGYEEGPTASLHVAVKLVARQ